MRSLNLGQIFVIAALIAMLVFAGIGIASVWDATNGVDDAAMDEDGWIALGLGAFVSVVLGCGLMALMLFSSRCGYDEAADPFRNRRPKA